MPLSKLLEMGSNEALAFLICHAFLLAFFFPLLFFSFLLFYYIFKSAGSGRLFSGVVIDTK